MSKKTEQQDQSQQNVSAEFETADADTDNDTALKESKEVGGSLTAREKLLYMRLNSNANKFVSDGDIIPFAWKHPLIETTGKKAPRKYKLITAAERERALMVPAPAEEDD